MAKNKYGISTKGWTPEFRTILGSVEGYIGAAGFSGQAVAKSPSELFSTLFHVYGIRTDPFATFQNRVIDAQEKIAALPRNTRKEVQKKSRADIAALGMAEFARVAKSHFPLEKPVFKAPPASAREKPKVAPKQATGRDKFYKSWEWRTLRMEVLKQHGPICMCCGAERGDINVAGEKVKICVDHIRPLARYWHLRLDRTNLQILCDECNQGKGAWDETDYRSESQRLIAEQLRYVV